MAAGAFQEALILMAPRSSNFHFQSATRSLLIRDTLRKTTMTSKTLAFARVSGTAALALSACAGLMLALPAERAQAQAAGSVSTKPISLTFQNAPIQSVLKTLFSSVGVNNSIDPNVTGTVNIDVRDVSFDVALRQLLRAANPPLTYDITDGVYHISVKNNAGPDAGTGQAPTQAQTTAPLPEGYHAYRIPIDHYDAAYIAGLLSKSRGGLTVVMPNYVLGGGGQGGQSGGGQGGQSGGFGGQGGGFGGQGGGQSSFGGGGGGGGFGGGRGFAIMNPSSAPSAK